jgi:non-heme chloroperoxidase
MEEDLFHFAEFHPQVEDAPPLLPFKARDQERLTYRFYESLNREKVIILLHGSSSHGEYFHQLGQHLSSHNCGEVYIPNLRGHYKSGSVRGDCAYVDQLEDDLYDLIEHFNLKNKKIFLIGHSSGGGLAIRFAGGRYGSLISGYVLLSPAIPLSSAMRSITAGGWASVSLTKTIFIKALNYLGITGLNHQQIVRFNKPKRFCDGTETLDYSYNLLLACQPHDFYKKDIAAMKGRFLLICGTNDEAHHPQAFPKVMNDPHSKNIHILEGVNHINLVLDSRMMNLVQSWTEQN